MIRRFEQLQPASRFRLALAGLALTAFVTAATAPAARAQCVFEGAPIACDAIDGDRDGLNIGDEVYVHGTNPYYFDTDGDGVGDGDEVDRGTNPLVADGDIIRADSDGDGLYDDDEAFVYGTDSLNPDTDVDGYLDGEEVYLGTNPLVADGNISRPDSDGDRLYDDDEAAVYGTNALVWDTDGDGYSDGEEVFAGSSPTNEFCDPNGCG